MTPTSPFAPFAFARRTVFSIAAFAALFALLVTFASDARAAGTMRVTTPSADEKDGLWTVKVRIDLPKAPGTLHVPMKFTFMKTMVYERAIMEKGKEPVLNKLTINPATKHIAQMIVDFADSMGKVHAATNFEFDLKRANGFFEAGEYTIQLEGPDGDIGSAQKLILKGDNPPIYRGAITFDGPGSKMQHVSSGVDAGPKDDPVAGPASTEVAPVGTATPMIPEEAFHKTPEEELRDHPKGCGCALPGLDVVSGLGAIGLAGSAIALAIARRRRRR
jgi:hypothetical protein